MSLDDLPRDRHMRRSGADYTHALTYLLPRGFAWPREEDTVLMRVMRGLAQIWGSPGVEPASDVAGTTQIVDARAGDLLEVESDPRKTIELLPDWERNWGLPDPCYPDTTTLDERRKMLILQMTLLGEQSREFFIRMAAWVGHDIKITEHAPFMVGVSRVGDTRQQNLLDGEDDQHFRWEIGPPEIRFYWTAHAGQARLIWFRCGVSQCGVDPHLRIGVESDLECLLDRWRPAHTELVYDYSSLFYGGSMAGTP
jgi:uncharacterized protein YmfQ (DUF2313 family)